MQTMVGFLFDSFDTRDMLSRHPFLEKLGAGQHMPTISLLEMTKQPSSARSNDGTGLHAKPPQVTGPWHHPASCTASGKNPLNRYAGHAIELDPATFQKFFTSPQAGSRQEQQGKQRGCCRQLRTWPLGGPSRSILGLPMLPPSSVAFRYARPASNVCMQLPACQQQQRAVHVATKFLSTRESVTRQASPHTISTSHASGRVHPSLPPCLPPPLRLWALLMLLLDVSYTALLLPLLLAYGEIVAFNGAYFIEVAAGALFLADLLVNLHVGYVVRHRQHTHVVLDGRQVGCGSAGRAAGTTHLPSC